MSLRQLSLRTGSGFTDKIVIIVVQLLLIPTCP